MDELGGPSEVSRLKAFRVSKVRQTALLYSDLAIPADHLGNFSIIFVFVNFFVVRVLTGLLIDVLVNQY